MVKTDFRDKDGFCDNALKNQYDCLHYKKCIRDYCKCDACHWNNDGCCTRHIQDVITKATAECEATNEN